MNDPAPSPERVFWTVFEPIHAISYFHAAFPSAMADAGLTGWWNGYFAGRAAPLGGVTAPVVTSLFFVFSPAKVANSVPKVWQRIAPEEAAQVRSETAGDVLERFSPDGDPRDLQEALASLKRCVDGLDFDGRALAAAWAGVVPRRSWLFGDLWLAATVLREHRGDGHVIAAAERGLTGLQASITHVATGQVRREVVQTTRGWSDEEWEAAEAELADRGILDGSGALTARGVALRNEVEEATDRLAAVPEDLDRVLRVLGPLARDVRGDRSFPASNPMGLPRPAAAE